MSSDYFDVSRDEIPVLLLAGPVAAQGTDYAVWISNVLGYSTGVVVDVRALISPDLATRLDIPYPYFDNDIPEDNGPGTIFVAAETPDATYLASDRSLDWVQKNGTERIVRGSFWLPEHPASLTITANCPAIGIAASLSLITEHWAQATQAITKLW